MLSIFFFCLICGHSFEQTNSLRILWIWNWFIHKIPKMTLTCCFAWGNKEKCLWILKERKLILAIYVFFLCNKLYYVKCILIASTQNRRNHKNRSGGTEWSKWPKLLYYWRAPRVARGVKNTDDQAHVCSGELKH